jgi:hypothetical protein
MASLVRKMFDTMPLTGVLGAAHKVLSPDGAVTVGLMVRHLKAHRKPPVLEVDPAAHGAEATADHASIWGWRAAGDPSHVEHVTCRVRDAAFTKHVVLESLDWGYAPTKDAKNLRKEVLVVFNRKEIVLPLSTEYHLVSFTTRGGYIAADNNAKLWPLESYHDESLLHVFAYDLDRASGAVLPLASPQHPDKQQVDAMLDRLEQMNRAAEDDTRNAGDLLFRDDLWDPTPSTTAPTGRVPEDVNLSLKAVRVLVACSLTACRERDDYQPGHLGGVGRLYPHVMVVATSALDRVEAGVHFKRPEKTTPEPDPGMDPHAAHHHSEHDEMLPDLKSLLIADSNEGGMVVKHVPFAPGPLTYWANMFSYYVVDPIGDSKVGDKLLPVVRGSKAKVRNEVGSVSRDCSDIRWLEGDIIFSKVNAHRVLKRERQGYFDNIHIAPRMRVKDPIAAVILGNHTPGRSSSTVAGDKTAWKMDEVVMAPFCAHDCFHMHWRWSDNQNDEQATFGWGPVKPSSEVGRVMVPENQDVFLQLLGHAEFSYLAHAHDVPKDAWQPFCHHGAGYALRIGGRMELAQRTAWLADHMVFTDGTTLGASRDWRGGWALFYWRLRYRLVGVGPTSLRGAYSAVALEERFAFIDENNALDC